VKEVRGAGVENDRDNLSAREIDDRHWQAFKVRESIMLVVRGVVMVWDKFKTGVLEIPLSSKLRTKYSPLSLSVHHLKKLLSRHIELWW
tara:strand:- start:126 stop:392 length:267 start_codon:yes stop_codon:yes gene_type:complete